MRATSYRHLLPSLELSIERNTSKVPNDDLFYLVKGDAVIGKYRYLKKAEEAFRALVKESGYRPPKEKPQNKSAGELSIEQYLDSKELYWAESHRFRGQGGKGGR
ncbi:MAG: hypothetical protein V3U26_07455, partial [Dehalococcoidia bacterium]